MGDFAELAIEAKLEGSVIPALFLAGIQDSNPAFKPTLPITYKYD